MENTIQQFPRSREESGFLVDNSIDKVPPQNIEAEMAVLGAMLLSPEAVIKAMELITDAVFYRDIHKFIFSAVIDMFDRNIPIDMLTLRDELKRRDQLDRVGGESYIATLLNTVPSAAHIEHYLRIVFEKYILRNLISVASGIIQESYRPDADAEVMLDNAEKHIFNISQQKTKNDFHEAKNLLKITIDQLDEACSKRRLVTGVATGYVDLDKKTSGLQPSDLIVIAARPSMGKTALALNIVENVALQSREAVAIFSLEMSKEQLVQRMLCSLARVDYSKIRSGFLERKDWPTIVDAAGKLSESKIFIDDTPAISLMELRAKARRLKASDDIKLIVIDYLQLMQAVGKRIESRQQEISEISRSLKALARELHVPVMVLSQLNRSVESRQDHRPMLSDLRESGAIEQDADVVILMVRPEYYNKDTRPGEADIIIAKQRNGPVGDITMRFFSEFARFDNFTLRDED
ncbi:MAG: replicative DNA helicase [Candidatus Auribacterota bacterium]|nr:replicative DNA helicase [Candidatus Auribacterota bacterium]